MKNREEPVRLFFSLLKEYMRSRGSMIFSLANKAEQKYLKIEFRGLMRRYRGTENYPTFMDLIRELTHTIRKLELKRYGIIDLVLEGSSGYIIIDTSKVRATLSE